MEKQLTIEKFEKKDIKEVLKIYNYYIKNTTATFSIEPIYEKEMQQLAFSGLERFPSYVLKVGEKVVGYSLLNRYKPREAYDKTAEVTIYLAHDQVGKGYGQKGLTHIIEQAKKFDFHALLAVVCAENTESIHLFEKNGFFQCAQFKEVGEKFGRILDVVVYEKILSARRGEIK